MTEVIRQSIEAADAEALRRHVSSSPSLADEDVSWGDGGKNVVPPLHFVCDAVFRGLATQDQALAMADVLLDAGVSPDRVYARSGDTFLIAAASLGAEKVGQRLVQRGADVTRRGLFGATALHWAAIMGLDHLSDALLEAGAEFEVRDSQYNCTPVEWALHGWTEGTKGSRDRIPRVARLLVERGARVPTNAAERLAKDADREMRRALGLATD